ncbi:MAG: DUF72 domain-containing protein [Candidatus Methanomethylicia archaeon]|nr:DUF72 domain-containing protein [Candidatus Methanomethylicia archaeon]
MKIYVGCCGIPGGLEKYSREFKVVELNNIFYKLPKPETAEKWAKIVPGDFVFCIKVFQGVTHPISSPTWKKSGIKDLDKLKNKVGFLKPTNEVFEFWKQTMEICKILKARICLIQLPESFRENEENLKNMDIFFSNIERKFPIALELRGWSREKFKEVCEKYDLISCVDPFKYQPVHFSKNNIAYFRLHGLGKKIYNYKFTDEDLQKLKSIVEELNVSECYVLFNNMYMYNDAKRFVQITMK